MDVLSENLRVKVFTDAFFDRCEGEVNKWLEQNRVRVLDIKHTMAVTDDKASLMSIVVVYEIVGGVS